MEKVEKSVTVELVNIDEENHIPKGLNFLIVDDEEDIIEITAESLQEIGFTGNFYKAASINEASKLLESPQTKIDFIISDWNLEELSGLDFLILVKSNSSYQSLPFLMVTANDNVSGMLIASKKGASDYLVKPWDISELREKVGSAWAATHK